MLPTGSGKTEVAMCVSKRIPGAVTLIVVPTIALAYDFERRLQDHFVRLDPRLSRNEMTFAWTSDTLQPERESLRDRLSRGIQPILVTSPESVTRALRNQLLELAATGRVAAFVVDEAHLVTQWGRAFRPEFRVLPRLRDDIVQRATDADRRVPVTLLLSATLNSDVVEDLRNLFGRPRACSMIAANALRAQPDFWVAPQTDESNRTARVLEALHNLPRPAVLYVTAPEEAESWLARLVDHGYQRLTTVTGETRPNERRNALAGLRTDGDRQSRFDLVVATSAFGLGIDYGHVRSVIHACVPETVDRWYQEVGRGGRDGDPCAALLCPAVGDWSEARRLGVKVLKAPTAAKYWKSLWNDRRPFGTHNVVDLSRAPGHAAEGSYTRRWNNQLVQGMVELNAIEPAAVLADDADRLSNGDDREHTWFAFDVSTNFPYSDGWWETVWSPWQGREMQRSRASLDRMSSIVLGAESVCSAIAEEYRPSRSVLDAFGPTAALMEPSGACGRCPGCRKASLERFAEPLPDPPQRWVPYPHDTSRLASFIASVGTDNGLAVIVAADPQALAETAAPTLLERGIRHFAGCKAPATQQVVFEDAESIRPNDLTPLPSMVVIQSGSLISLGWLNLSARKANRPMPELALDVLLISDDVTIPKGLRTRTGPAALALLGITN
jgi:hypothetical protein